MCIRDSDAAIANGTVGFVMDGDDTCIDGAYETSGVEGYHMVEVDCIENADGNYDVPSQDAFSHYVYVPAAAEKMCIRDSIGIASESSALGNFGDWQIRRGQQFDPLLDAQIHHVFNRGFSGYFFEQTDQPVVAYMDNVAQLRDLDFIHIVFIDMSKHRTQFQIFFILNALFQ